MKAMTFKKITIETGSYVITASTQRLIDNINDNNDKFMGDILREILDDLHSRDTQILTFTCNNGTKFYQVPKK